MMLGKTFRYFVIPFLSFSILCSAGFCVWLFSSEIKTDASLTGGVLLENEADLGRIRFVDPLQLDFQEYRIIFEQKESNEIYNETSGIRLIPSLKFELYDYHPTEKLEKPAEVMDYQFYYYFDFSHEGLTFSSEGYGEYVSQSPAHSFETRQILEVDWTKESTSFTFEPVFHYQEGRKPNSSSGYAKMLEDIYNDKSPSIFTLHVSFEKGG